MIAVYPPIITRMKRNTATSLYILLPEVELEFSSFHIIGERLIARISPTGRKILGAAGELEWKRLLDTASTENKINKTDPANIIAQLAIQSTLILRGVEVTALSVYAIITMKGLKLFITPDVIKDGRFIEENPLTIVTRTGYPP